MIYWCHHVDLPPTSRARETLAAGVLEPRDKKIQEEFQDSREIEGLPSLPDGYVITEWMR